MIHFSLFLFHPPVSLVSFPRGDAFLLTPIALEGSSTPMTRPWITFPPAWFILVFSSRSIARCADRAQEQHPPSKATHEERQAVKHDMCQEQKRTAKVRMHGHQFWSACTASLWQAKKVRCPTKDATGDDCEVGKNISNVCCGMPRNQQYPFSGRLVRARCY